MARQLEERDPPAPASEIIALRKRAFASEPHYDAQMALVVKAWRQAGSCRAIGMAAGPVPWDAVQRWCEVEGLDADATELMHAVIEMLDEDHFERAESKRRLDALTGPKRR